MLVMTNNNDADYDTAVSFFLVFCYNIFCAPYRQLTPRRIVEGSGAEKLLRQAQ